MGYWGEGLFQNDSDLDYITDLAADAGVEDLYCPEDVDAVRKKLDDGTLKRILNQVKDEKYDSGYLFFQRYHEYCILAAAAMSVGAQIDADDMTQLKSVYRNAGLLKDGTKQMEKALNEYPNDGTPWDFDSPGLLETMMRASEPTTPETQAGGFTLLNVFPEATAEKELHDICQKAMSDFRAKEHEKAKENKPANSESKGKAKGGNTDPQPANEEEQSKPTVTKGQTKK